MESILIIWKNKGFMVPIYFIISTFIAKIVIDVLSSLSGNLFESINKTQILIGLALILSGIITYKYRDDYAIIKNNKVKLDLINEFFFIRMESWGYLKVGLGVLIIIGTGIEYFID